MLIPHEIVRRDVAKISTVQGGPEFCEPYIHDATMHPDWRNKGVEMLKGISPGHGIEEIIIFVTI